MAAGEGGKKDHSTERRSVSGKGGPQQEKEDSSKGRRITAAGGRTQQEEDHSRRRRTTAGEEGQQERKTLQREGIAYTKVRGDHQFLRNRRETQNEALWVFFLDIIHGRRVRHRNFVMQKTLESIECVFCISMASG